MWYYINMIDKKYYNVRFCCKCNKPVLEINSAYVDNEYYCKNCAELYVQRCDNCKKFYKEAYSYTTQDKKIKHICNNCRNIKK